MNLTNKIYCFLFLVFLAIEIFAQEQFYVSINGTIKNSFARRSSYYVPNVTPLRNNNSTKILDSLICLYLNGNRIKLEYYYNNDLSLYYFIISNWFNDKWIITEKHTYRYNFKGDIESILWEFYNPSLKEWVKDAKDVFNYDTLGNKIVYLHQIYDGQEFLNFLKCEYFYDTYNNLVSSITQDWVDTKWVNTTRTIYTYTPEKLNDTVLFQIWSNEQWINHSMNIYKYDEKFNVKSNLAKRWIENNWVNFGMGTFEYDSNNNCVFENWVIAYNNNWENWFRIFYEYDADNYLIHIYGEKWVNGIWIPGEEALTVTNPDGIPIGFQAEEIFLYYSVLTNLRSEKNNGFNLFQNYPNPFNSTTTIKYSVPKSQFVSLKIFDMLGQEIITLVNENKDIGNYEITFDAKNLPSGIYFYQLQYGNFLETKKFVLIK